MTTNLPGSKDSTGTTLPDPAAAGQPLGSGTANQKQRQLTLNLRDAVLKLEDLVGIPGSTDPASLDYMMENHAHTSGVDDGGVIPYSSLSGRTHALGGGDHSGLFTAAQHPVIATTDLHTVYIMETYLVWSWSGNVVVMTGKHRVRVNSNYKLLSASGYVDTPPVGSAIRVDLNIEGTTVWATQSRRLNIAAGGNESIQTVFDTTTINAGQHFTWDVDAVGSSTAGADLGLTLVLGRI